MQVYAIFKITKCIRLWIWAPTDGFIIFFDFFCKMQRIKRYISRSKLMYWAVCYLLISITKAEYFTVQRGFTENGSNKLEDIITLPLASRWCGENFTKCSDFDAVAFPNKPCSCVCPLARNTLQGHSNNLGCTQNSKIRKQGKFILILFFLTNFNVCRLIIYCV